MADKSTRTEDSLLSGKAVNVTGGSGVVVPPLKLRDDVTSLPVPSSSNSNVNVSAKSSSGMGTKPFSGLTDHLPKDYKGSKVNFE